MLPKTLIASVLLLIGVSTAAQDAKPVDPCDGPERAFYNLQTWSDLQQWFSQYQYCDDGGIAEAVDSFIEDKLVNDWQSIKDLNMLIQRYPSFRKAFFAHVGTTFECSNAKLIVSRAEAECIEGCQSLCRDISKALREDADPTCLPASQVKK